MTIHSSSICDTKLFDMTVPFFFEKPYPWSSIWEGFEYRVLLRRLISSVPSNHDFQRWKGCLLPSLSSQSRNSSSRKHINTMCLSGCSSRQRRKWYELIPGQTIRSVHDRLRWNTTRERILFSEVISWSVILPYGRWDTVKLRRGKMLLQERYGVPGPPQYWPCYYLGILQFCGRIRLDTIALRSYAI